MSLKALAFAWDYDATGPIQKFVLIALADQAQDCGHLWPSVASIAERMGVADARTIRRHITALAEAGIVKRIENFARQGRQTSNIYEIVGLPDPKPCSDMCHLGGAEMSGLSEGLGRTEMPGSGGAQMSGPSMNRKKEPKKKLKKKIAEQSLPWESPASMEWAHPLVEMSQVHADPPRPEWMVELASPYIEAFLVEEVRKFVDYYLAPDTRKLTAWKTALRTWFKRAHDRVHEQMGISSVVMHDTSLPKGKCGCRMCLRRAATG